MGDHFSADLFGAVAAAFVFADADADGGVGGKGRREEVEDAAVVPPDGGGSEQVVFEAVGGGEEGVEAEQGAEGVSEQGLFFGVDGVFVGKGWGEFVVEEGGEAVCLSKPLTCFSVFFTNSLIGGTPERIFFPPSRMLE